MATTATLDTSKSDYQPLVALAHGANSHKVSGEALSGAIAEISKILEPLGFVWLAPHADRSWSDGKVVAHLSWSGADKTAGIECHSIASVRGSAYEPHYYVITGQYDALPLSEKHRMSGCTQSLEDWAAKFGIV